MRTDSSPSLPFSPGFILLPLVGHPNMGGPMRMNPPRGMAMGPQVLELPDTVVTEAHLAAVVSMRLSDRRCAVWGWG